jgi:hypothetical protein
MQGESPEGEETAVPSPPEGEVQPPAPPEGKVQPISAEGEETEVTQPTSSNYAAPAAPEKGDDPLPPTSALAQQPAHEEKEEEEESAVGRTVQEISGPLENSSDGNPLDIVDPDRSCTEGKGNPRKEQAAEEAVAIAELERTGQWAAHEHHEGHEGQAAMGHQNPINADSQVQEAPTQVGEGGQKTANQEALAQDVAVSQVVGAVEAAVVVDPQELHIYEYEQLREATDSFNQKPVAAGGRLLGAGGFGAVYSGMLKHADSSLLIPVAVKTLDQDEEVGAASGITAAEQFAAEVQILSDLHHENLVMLLGFSMDGERRCLVYSLMQHGALGEIHDRFVLWSTLILSLSIQR